MLHLFQCWINKVINVCKDVVELNQGKMKTYHYSRPKNKKLSIFVIRKQSKLK